mmetsp:Transcript_9020/g.10513  ORF Transcript_9020/g.10513 Transcript_9020/m.10513 type:complete len:364 (+) Transcript_9020:141-1232(+)
MMRTVQNDVGTGTSTNLRSSIFSSRWIKVLLGLFLLNYLDYYHGCRSISRTITKHLSSSEYLPELTKGEALALDLCGHSPSKEIAPGARRKAYITTLPASENPEEPCRLKNMKQIWKQAYPELEMEEVFSFRSPIRGLAVVVTLLLALDHAERDNIDLALFLEDDAVPFNISGGLTWVEEFNAALEQWPTNSLALFLGAHNIQTYAPPEHHHKLDDNSESRSRVILLKEAFGAYAFAVRRAHFQCLREHIQRVLSYPNLRLNGKWTYDHDWFWWHRDQLFAAKTPAFLTTPLLVDHSSGFSVTWGKSRRSSWMGQRDWWNYQKKPEESYVHIYLFVLFVAIIICIMMRRRIPVPRSTSQIRTP